MFATPATAVCRFGRRLRAAGIALVLLALAAPSRAAFTNDPVFDTSTASTMKGLIAFGPNHVCDIFHDTNPPGTYTFRNNDPSEPHLYQKYDYYNNGPDRCVTVTMNWKHDNCDFEIGLALYLDSFDPNDPTKNLLAHSFNYAIQDPANTFDNEYTKYRYSPGYYRDRFQDFTLDWLDASAVVPALAHVVVVLDSTYQPGQPPLVCPKPTGSLVVYSFELSEQGPAISVSDTSSYEFGPAANQGGTLQFGLSLSAQAALPVTIHVKTSDGTAVSTGLNPDYTPVDKDVTFQPGETFKYVDVPIVGDANLESNETMTLTLSNPNPPAIPLTNTTATGRIDDDDSLVGTCHIQTPGANLPFGVVGQAYGPVPMVADGEVAGEFSWSLTNPSCLPPGLTLHDESNANASIDGTPTQAGTFTCTVHLICPTSDSGTESKDSPVTIVIQPETPQVIISLDPVTVTEGNSGFTPAHPIIHLSSPAAADFNLEVVLEDASAQAGDSDYQTLSPGQLIGINKGDTTVPIPLNVIGDLKVEGDEKFIVHLRTPVTHEEVATAAVTIINDDVPEILQRNAVPTLGHAGLAVLALGLAGFAFFRLRSGS